MEKALDTQLAENYDLVARITPENSRAAFRFLLKKWDIKNIKSVIIAKEAGLTTEETIDLVIPFGELTDKLDTLIDADDINEVLNTLEGTEYAPILEDAIPIYQETGKLLPLEASLDATISIADMEGEITRRVLDLVRSEFEEKSWLAFQRTVVDGKLAADVAVELGMTVAAVYKAKSRIFRRLRQQLGDLPK